MADLWLGHHRFRSKLLILVAIGITILGLILLGNWQLRRLEWKLALIERVESRVAAEPVNAPGEAAWSAVSRENHEYLHVRVRGRFLHEKETLVWAVTERGNGYWVLTPLLSESGETYLVNRGYLPADATDPALRRAGWVDDVVEVTGLLRLSEPGGSFLRNNDAAADRWYSRDVDAMARARGLRRVAPYFIDAGATEVTGGLPVGGMTRLQFRNAHLIYALTWYGLALLLAIMTAWAIRHERKDAATHALENRESRPE